MRTINIFTQTTIVMNLPKRLFDFPYYQLATYPLDAMMTSRVNGNWTSVSTESFVEKMNLISRGLISLGIKPGDRVAIITHANRYEWDVMDHGIMQIGGIDVPIYPTMTESDCRYIMNHAETRLCFVSNEELYEKICRVKPDVPSLEAVYTFDQIDGAKNWTELFDIAQSVPQEEVKILSAQVKDEDLATIIYTSGTTGLPKGVMLSHRNIASNALDCEERLPLLDKGKSRCLSFLPISHIYERMLHYMYIANGIHMYLGGMETIKEDLAVAQPHMFTGVPRLFEKFYDAIFFSAQTLTTVGYGRISPVGFSTNLIAAIESLFGVISFALLTGICFGKFSRPSAKILFSKNIVVAPYKNANALMFRLVNARKNQFIESEIQVVLALNALKDGERKRIFYRLNLEIEKINFFPLPWTIVHPIDEKSPLNNMQIKEFEEGNPEISIMFKQINRNDKLKNVKAYY
jgi:hypothetical protein